MKYTPQGKAVTNFSLATNEKWTGSDGEQQERVIWWNIEVWGKSAEAANKYLEKASLVLVEGRIKADSDTGGPRVYKKRDGSAGASFEVVAVSVKFLDSKEE